MHECITDVCGDTITVEITEAPIQQHAAGTLVWIHTEEDERGATVALTTTRALELAQAILKAVAAIRD